jgi:dTDP-4-dehydrorhamnose 3,5-epimerase
VPENCNGIMWNDEIINIQWPLHQIDKIIISEKDKKLQTFNQYRKVLSG